MNIFEHQSTFNPNMPVRELMYVGRLYDKYIHRNHLNVYSEELLELPVPKLVVFYNGLDQKEDEKILELKDSFPPELRDGVSDVSVRVKMLNVNRGRNRALMKACRPLAEYAWLIDEIRKNKRSGMEIEPAVDKALEDMPPEYEIRDYLIANKSEVRNMCITEYNEEETLQIARKSLYEEFHIL